ncbi:hypothetical protein GCM10023153_22350 [Ornithinibacter aureus]|uniref:Ig-like domain-containing protein n=1 Tax=Ornithinibacter aureus TaxID=622664 RepID=A0ABP8JZB8_9MICO|nr:hypothetical protein [Ornithinibacter aureus]KAF0835385.1 hypothetical protein C8E84_3265 [Ornithinibacter aureus]
MTRRTLAPVAALACLIGVWPAMAHAAIYEARMYAMACAPDKTVKLISDSPGATSGNWVDSANVTHWWSPRPAGVQSIYTNKRSVKSATVTGNSTIRSFTYKCV